MDSRVMKAIEKVFDPKRFYLVRAFDVGDEFLLQMNRTDHRGKKIMLDPWYTINKKSLEVEFFNPSGKSKVFENAFQNPVEIGGD